MELSLKNVTSYDKNKYTKISLEKRINILYGQNGAGKSTISNFFYNPADDDYRDCRCTNINNYRPLVYNTKFIEDNFFDKDVQKGIFTLSKENTEIEKEISKKREIVKTLKIKLEATKTNYQKIKDRNHDAETSCTESIWLNTEYIRNSDVNSLMAGYLKNKRNLFTKVKSSIRLPDIDLNQLLTDYRELLNHKNTTIQTISPYNPYPISFDDKNLLKTPVIDSSNSYLSETIKKLQNLDWVKKGKENYLVGDICPFCQKETIDDKFTEALEQIFDESYAQKITSIEKLKYIYELTTQEQLQLLKTQLNDCTAISIEERKTSLAHISSLEKMLKSNIELINNKIQNPSLSVTLDKDKDIEESLLKDIKQYNSRINDLNEKVKQFNLTQDKIKNQFWGALRNYRNTDFEVLEKIQAENDIIIKSLEESIDSINKEIKHTDDEIKELRNKTSNIDTTISSINSKLKNLGITCFYIDKHPTIKNSFVIVRSDNTPSKNVYRSLSEGEKTLITFLYFIEYCKGQTNTDEFDNRDSLIVIDDPISSLSQNYIYDIASMIHYDIFTSANKVIILTHNLYFFHELIKLAPISERKFNSTYQLFRITKNLHSSFSNISRDSLQNEYQSLWQILKDARDGKVHNVVIPNTMRNILEYYFAFVHKTNELQDELNRLAQNESNSNFKAFYRYINRGSHSDSINITDMGEITPDIYITQFKEIFRLMGDISHFNKMYEEKKNIEDTTA